MIYKKYQDSLLEQCKGRGFVDVSGEGRCDSPGYNAKFSTYSIMDELTSKILLFHIVTVAETGSYSSMEKLGLIKVLEKSDSLQLDLGCITTDEHPSIKKYLCEKRKKHQLDVWHKVQNL